MSTMNPELAPLDWYVNLFTANARLSSVNICRNLDDVRKAIPPHLFKRSTLRGISYYARDFSLVTLLWFLGCQIDPTVERYASAAEYGVVINGLIWWTVWAIL